MRYENWTSSKAIDSDSAKCALYLELPRLPMASVVVRKETDPVRSALRSGEKYGAYGLHLFSTLFGIRNTKWLQHIDRLPTGVGRVPIDDQEIWFTQVSLTSTSPASAIILATVSRGQKWAMRGSIWSNTIARKVCEIEFPDEPEIFDRRMPSRPTARPGWP